MHRGRRGARTRKQGKAAERSGTHRCCSRCRRALPPLSCVSCPGCLEMNCLLPWSAHASVYGSIRLLECGCTGVVGQAAAYASLS